MCFHEEAICVILHFMSSLTLVLTPTYSHRMDIGSNISKDSTVNMEKHNIPVDDIKDFENYVLHSGKIIF